MVEIWNESPVCFLLKYGAKKLSERGISEKPTPSLPEHFGLVASVIIADFAKAISIRPPPSLEGGLGRELARAEATVFGVIFRIWFGSFGYYC